MALDEDRAQSSRGENLLISPRVPHRDRPLAPCEDRLVDRTVGDLPVAHDPADRQDAVLRTSVIYDWRVATLPRD